MDLLEAVSTSFENLGRHKMRTFLTMLGIIIGVASVIMMATLGTSVKNSVISNFDILQPDMMTITAAARNASDLGHGPAANIQPGLVFTDYDIQNIEALEEYVSAVIPTGSIPIVSLESNGSVRTTVKSLTATVAEANALNADFESGTAFSEGSSECVIGYDVALLFNESIPLKAGDTITFNLMNGASATATISGVLNKSTDLVSRFMGVDNSIYVPIDPFYSVILKSPSTNESTRVFGSIGIKAKDVSRLGDAQKAVLDYLNGENSDAKKLVGPDIEFRALTQESTAKQISSAIDTLTTFIGAIAAISLVVGSIGIANIMLVTVTERTREIGIMKAVGAKSRDVLQIFLTESVLIGIMGSAAGCILGPLLGYIVVNFILSVPVAFNYSWFFISVIAGAGVGAIAGYYPARKATKVDPIVALRYE